MDKKNHGFRMIPDWVVRALMYQTDDGLNGVAAWLAIHFNTWGEKTSCYPSVARLREFVPISDSSMRRGLKALQKIGALKVEMKKGQKSTYTLLWRPVQAKSAV